MEVLESLRDTAHAEFSSRFIKAAPEDQNPNILLKPFAAFGTVAPDNGWHLLPVPEQTPDLSTQTGLQQHVHIFVILECAIQSGENETQTSLALNTTNAILSSFEISISLFIPFIYLCG